jgi:hypothetical protein
MAKRKPYQPAPSERKMLRINLDPQLVASAKRQYGRGAQFRKVLDSAIEAHLGEIDALLAAAGFKQHEESETTRIWPVSFSAIDQLDKVAEKRGLARTEIIRALLVLASRPSKRKKT